MDLGTLIGIVAGFGLIIGSILLGGSLTSFVNAPSLLVVVGGTVAATLIAQKLTMVIGAFKVAMNAFVDRAPSVEKTADQLQKLATQARKDGILALENVKVSHAFLGKAIRMAVDGVQVDVIRSTLSSEVAALLSRHQTGQKVFRFMAATAPSMGMIGTLIGLVQMLQTLDDPSSIGPAMAVALLTTLYGAVLAFLVFGPIADKLEGRTQIEAATMAMIIAGIGSVVDGENAAILREKLDAFLSPQARKAGKKSA